MDYQTYLRNKDKQRRRNKNYALYALYLLIPLFLIGSTFTDERIISKCKDIYEEKVVYEQIIQEKEVEISRLKGDYSSQVDSLSDHLDETESNCEASLAAANERINALTTRIAQLERENTEKDAYISQLEKDKSELTDHNNQLQERITEKNREIAELQNQLRACERASNNWEGQFNAMKEDRDRYKGLYERYKGLYESEQEKYASCAAEQDNLIQDRDRYKRLYDAEKRKFTTCSNEKEALIQDRDRYRNLYTQMKEKYENLRTAQTTVSIDPISSIPGDEFMWIKTEQRYRVVVNGKVVRYIMGDPCLR